MTHDSSYVATLPTSEQIQQEFVNGKGNGSHTSLLRILRCGMTVAQLERYIQDEVREHYLKLKASYIVLWDKVHARTLFKGALYLTHVRFTTHSIQGRVLFNVRILFKEIR